MTLRLGVSPHRPLTASMIRRSAPFSVGHETLGARTYFIRRVVRIPLAVATVSAARRR